MPRTLSRRVEDAVEQADELGIFPAVATRVMRIAESPNASILDLEKAVSTDANLSAQVLKIANSGFFGLSRQVGSVQEALFVLGFDNTRDLAVALSVGSLGRSPRKGRRGLWLHSLRTAVLAQKLAELVDHGRPRELFVVGLLHDLGKLVLLELAEKRYAPMLEAAHGPALVAAELEELGFDHAALGGACLDHWTLPETFAQAVRRHHAVRPGDGAPDDDATLSACLLAFSDALGHAAEPLQQDSDGAAARLETDEELAAWLAAFRLEPSRAAVADAVATLDATVAALQLT